MSPDWVKSSFPSFNTRAKASSTTSSRKRPRPNGSIRRAPAAPVPASETGGAQVRRSLPPGPANCLWIDEYAPSEPSDIVVHSAKVKEVNFWLEQGYQNQPILFLSGPSGSGKASTVATLARSMGLNLVEWVNPIHSLHSNLGSFCEFLFRGTKYAGANDVFLVKELPLFTSTALDDFRYRLALLSLKVGRPAPRVVFVLTAFTMPQELYTASSRNKFHEYLEPRDLILSNYRLHFRVIEFNPVAPTFMKKALQKIVKARSLRLDILPVIEASSGDLRCAINMMQFAALWQPPPGRARAQRIDFKGIGAKEASRGLFSALGRILYDKRVAPLPPSSTSTSVASAFAWAPPADTTSTTPPCTPSTSTPLVISLPPHLADFARAPLEVSPEALLAQLPVSSDVYGVFLYESLVASTSAMEMKATAANFLPGLAARVFVSREYSDADALPPVARDLVRVYAAALAHGVRDHAVDLDLREFLLGADANADGWWSDDGDMADGSGDTILAVNTEPSPAPSSQSGSSGGSASAGGRAVAAPAPSYSSRTRGVKRTFQALSSPRFYTAQREQDSYRTWLRRAGLSPLDAGLRGLPNLDAAALGSFPRRLGKGSIGQAPAPQLQLLGHSGLAELIEGQEGSQSAMLPPSQTLRQVNVPMGESDGLESGEDNGDPILDDS